MAPETPAGAVRLGTGEVRVTHLEYLDGHGAAASVLVAGEPATFRIHYQADQPVAEPVFGLGFVHESGVNLAGPNSGSGLEIAEVRGQRLRGLPRAGLSSCPAFRGDHRHRAQGPHLRLRRAGLRSPGRGSGTDEPGLIRLTGDWAADQDEVGAVVHNLHPGLRREELTC